ncbi:MAG: N-acetylmuramoyl-L-alanine amidase [Sarcina sp.]
MYLAQGAIISGDASHNCCPDSGSVGLRIEKECTKEIWNLVKKKLENLKFKIVDCTPWNKEFYCVGESLAYRVKYANDSLSVLHLCIDLGNYEGGGVECWISDSSERAAKFAKNICEYISNLGYYNRGVKVGELYITDYTLMPCVLIKCCSFNSLEDMKKYNAESIAEAITKAITTLGTK